MRYKVIKQTFKIVAMVIKAGKQLLSQGKIETKARFLDMRPQRGLLSSLATISKKSLVYYALSVRLS